MTLEIIANIEGPDSPPYISKLVKSFFMLSINSLTISINFGKQQRTDQTAQMRCLIWPLLFVSMEAPFRHHITHIESLYNNILGKPLVANLVFGYTFTSVPLIMSDF